MTWKDTFLWQQVFIAAILIVTCGGTPDAKCSKPPDDFIGRFRISLRRGRDVEITKDGIYATGPTPNVHDATNLKGGYAFWITNKNLTFEQKTCTDNWMTVVFGQSLEGNKMAYQCLQLTKDEVPDQLRARFVYDASITAKNKASVDCNDLPRKDQPSDVYPRNRVLKTMFTKLKKGPKRVERSAAKEKLLIEDMKKWCHAAHKGTNPNRKKCKQLTQNGKELASKFADPELQMSFLLYPMISKECSHRKNYKKCDAFFAEVGKKQNVEIPIAWSKKELTFIELLSQHCARKPILSITVSNCMLHLKKTLKNVSKEKDHIKRKDAIKESFVTNCKPSPDAEGCRWDILSIVKKVWNDDPAIKGLPEKRPSPLLRTDTNPLLRAPANPNLRTDTTTAGSPTTAPSAASPTTAPGAPASATTAPDAPASPNATLTTARPTTANVIPSRAPITSTTTDTVANVPPVANAQRRAPKGVVLYGLAGGISIFTLMCFICYAVCTCDCEKRKKKGDDVEKMINLASIGNLASRISQNRGSKISQNSGSKISKNSGSKISQKGSSRMSQINASKMSQSGASRMSQNNASRMSQGNIYNQVDTGEYENYDNYGLVETGGQWLDENYNNNEGRKARKSKKCSKKEKSPK
ncbi:unnamed protein product [Owenia fusiformis]|uniref:Uncharacterized protein n=1 Tax=Owenia fusiformis TaxID=6347 RepID=A0A8J1TNT8_OWEFU|nr:unnamed protein product [Owenia fusiformis]